MLCKDSNDFINTKKYLLPLIVQATQKIKNQEKREQMIKDLENDVATAAQRFMKNLDGIRNKYSFAVYFTWYIHQRFKKESFWYKLKKMMGTSS